MRTLFPSEVNWGVFFILAIVLRIIFPAISLVSYFALVLALHQFTLLITSIGHIVPVRYLFGAFMALQFFIGPSLAYNGFDQYQYQLYKMKISEAEYFSYAIPAVISFIIGLHITAGNYNGEILDEEGIEIFVKNNPKIPYVFIILGFVASIISSFFSSEVAFVFYLIGSFKFIGLFMLIVGERSLKLGPLVLVLGSIIASSLGLGMFQDLLTWILFLGSIYAIKYRFGFNLKLMSCIGFILLAVIIQQLKGTYRAAIGKGGQEAGLETLSNSYESKREDGSLFSFSSLAPSVVRINQGFIITNIMNTVPDRVAYSNGEEMGQIIEAAIMPRILDPDKLQAGDRGMFEKYSGIHLRAGTSMGLSSLGDAYLNFGVIGGCFFMFVLGFIYSSVLNYFNKRSMRQPVILLFLPLIFYYPIRPDCELQTILGHLVKATFILLMMVYFWKSVFVDKVPEELDKLPEEKNILAQG